MKFADLKPIFRNPKEPVTIQNAWGVTYDCPQCFLEGRVRRIYTPLRGEHGWQVSGTSRSIFDVTITPSVRVNPGFHCLGHWTIINGEVHIHSDSCSNRVRIRLPTWVRPLEHHHHGR